MHNLGKVIKQLKPETDALENGCADIMADVDTQLKPALQQASFVLEKVVTAFSNWQDLTNRTIKTGNALPADVKAYLAGQPIITAAPETLEEPELGPTVTPRTGGGGPT